MARLRGLRSARPTSPGRRTAWGFGPATTGPGGLQTITASGKLLFGVAAAAVTDGQTIVRTRGELVALLSSADAVTSGFHGAFGIAKVTAQAVAIGVTAVPGPLTDDDWDGWLYHRYLSCISADPATTTGAVTAPLQLGAGSGAIRLEVDSKAMRKIAENESVVAMMEMMEIGVASLRVFFNSRLLVKLQ